MMTSVFFGFLLASATEAANVIEDYYYWSGIHRAVF
jgi:hypothetical protein